MACVCFVYVCDVHHVDTRMWICFWRISGETTGKGTPSPFQGRATVRLPPSKFFYFFSTLPHNIIHLPIFFVPERFSLPLCVFPYPCVFSCLRGQKIRGNKNFFLSYLCLCGYYKLYSHSLLCFSVVSPYCFTLCVMFLHCLLLWMLCFSLICPFFCPLWGFLCFRV